MQYLFVSSKSSAKRDALSKAKRATNRAQKSALRTTIKKFDAAILEGDKEKAASTFQAAVKAIDSKRGQDIEVIKVGDITVLTDYFVFATASSNTQLRAIADEIEFKLKEQGIDPHHIEGEKSEWVCLDYTGVVIHVLLSNSRDFYQIERLWEDGEKIDIDEIIVKE